MLLRRSGNVSLLHREVLESPSLEGVHETWRFSTEIFVRALTVGLDDLRGVFQP